MAEKAASAPNVTKELPTPLPPSASPAHTFRFWGIFVALCLLSFISALDVAIITTALPTITAEIGGAKEYTWIANSFVLASSVFQPLLGQLANLFGRRKPLIVSTMLFALGSGVGGGATNPSMLIAGRTIQGVGAGGIYVLLDIVCCDLVSLKERGKYLGLMFSWSGVAAALGPVVGGALAQADWRWIFYLNIPICGAALAAILLFMRVKDGGSTVNNGQKSKFLQLDYLGNLIFIPSIISVLLGLVMGGIEYPWSSWHVILPLVLGIIGWIAFHIQQHFSSNPSVPTRLFSNRTSAAAFVLTFLSSVLVQAISYFLPSGINFLPFAIGTLVFATMSGILLSKFGAYRPLHATAFALSAVGFGLFTLLDGSTSKVAWAFFQLIASAGSGMILSILLPAIMAGLPESDVASASAAYSFVRTFGYIWGVTIASIIFNSEFNKHLSSISSPTLQKELEVYVKSLRTIWWVGLAFSIVGFFVVGAERGLELRKELETEYGIDDEKKATTKDNGGTVEALELS
ncbi:major Facilitator Superfamily protein [Rutstroemia sp. NJR-2017a BBW]|nr:major Facilitator Superfamily protein [Rutstroemia sp. NJR-2017a BBW]